MDAGVRGTPENELLRDGIQPSLISSSEVKASREDNEREEATEGRDASEGSETISMFSAQNLPAPSSFTVNDTFVPKVSVDFNSSGIES